MKIAILGYGTVGKGVEEIALREHIEVAHILMRDCDELFKDSMTADYDEILADGELDCIVECIGGDEPAHTYVLKALERGINVVSSNKKMLVKHLKELFEKAEENKAVLLFSAACGGGIPWLRELSYVRDNEEVCSFRGIMNGTSNYILDQMDRKGLDFADVLREAQKLGYAEADPSDDIDGVDTANKVILSSAVAFRRYFRLEDVFVRGIRHLQKEDLEYAKKNGYRIVLLGKGMKKDERYHLSVMPAFVPKDTILGSVHDNYNCFTLDSADLRNMVFIGQGAGSLPTASNVIRDIRTLERPYMTRPEEEERPDNGLLKNAYYLRTDRDIGQEYIDRKLSSGAYLTKKISIEELQEICGENDFTGVFEDDQGM
ncbi:MAG: homoserine dehydrogenase [Erysipelotrichaceae bacterium]|nr:homoserine dehydrogenase [Erysipelotrichaceae bacterium]